MSILITGAFGFLGSAVIRLIKDRTSEILLTPTHSELDLEDKTAVYKFLAEHQDITRIIHLAAVVGGLKYNQLYPFDLTARNLAMSTNLLQGIVAAGIKPFITFVSTTCGFPEIPRSIPFVEDEFFSELPEPTNRGYGMAKRMISIMLDELKKQHGIPSVTIIPTNLFGPGDELSEERSHVVPAIIQKFISQQVAKLWGDGSSSRDLLFVDDAAEAIIEATLRKVEGGLVNIGSGRETTIAELASIIKHVGDFNNSFSFGGEVGNGQQRRCLNINKAKRLLGWEPKVSLESGLSMTVTWIRNQIND
jgi:GDP-L-fucose synthase